MTPENFASSFMKQPYPTMGLAPSAVLAKTGPNVVQEGSNQTTAYTGQSMWARISSAVPFGYTIDAFFKGKEGTKAASSFVQEKIKSGAQASNGFVKSATDTVKGVVMNVKEGVQATVSYSKWLIVGLVAVAVILVIKEIKDVTR